MGKRSGSEGGWLGSDGERGPREERGRGERESEGKRTGWSEKGVPKRSVDIADLLTDLRRGNERGHGLEKGKSPR